MRAPTANTASMSVPTPAGWGARHASLAEHPDDDPCKQAMSAAPETDGIPHVDPATVSHKQMWFPVAMRQNWSDVRAMLSERWKSTNLEFRVDPGMLEPDWRQTGVVPEKEEAETTLNWLAFDAMGFTDFVVPAFQIAYDAFQTHEKGRTEEQRSDKDPKYDFKCSSAAGPSVSWYSWGNGMDIRVTMLVDTITFDVWFTKVGACSYIFVGPDRTVDKKRKREDKDDKDDDSRA